MVTLMGKDKCDLKEARYHPSLSRVALLGVAGDLVAPGPGLVIGLGIGAGMPGSKKKSWFFNEKRER